MKKEIAEKWVAALRSGEYKQYTSFLADAARTQHCCLGVLCELAIKDGMGIEASCDDTRTYTRFDGEGSRLPKYVMAWANTGASVAVTDRYSLDKLALMNDNGSSFKEIAATIEEHWETI